VRPDLLPLDYIKELEKLQDEVCCSEEVKIDEIFNLIYDFYIPLFKKIIEIMMKESKI